MSYDKTIAPNFWGQFRYKFYLAIASWTPTLTFSPSSNVWKDFDIFINTDKRRFWILNDFRKWVIENNFSKS